MADLMKGSSSFEDLSKKYKNFLVPAFKIKVKGKDLVRDTTGAALMAIDNLRLSLSLDSGSSCSFTVHNVYDIASRNYTSSVKSALQLGTVVEVEIGYASTTSVAFKGYIAELGYEFTDAPVIDVTCLDVCRLMQEGRRTQVHTVQNYSDAFTEVMNNYKSICTQQVIDKTDDKLKTVDQNSSDYEFVTKELAPKAVREFFVFAGKAYFREPQKDSDPAVKLQWGAGLKSFSRTVMYHNSEIKVISFDEANKKAVEGTAKSKSGDKQTAAADATPTILTLPDVKDEAQAQKIAEDTAKKKKKKTEGGSGSSIGLPEIVPGRYIALAELDSSLDNDYYVNSVSHALGSGGFTTSFTVRGWKE
jgi:phage protein D